MTIIIMQRLTSKISRAVLYVLLMTLILHAGCVSMPPMALPKPPRRPINPLSYQMKLAVFNFQDQTGSAGKLIETIPDVLATELFNKKRFTLKERAELRAVDVSKMEEIRTRYRTEVDAFLVGSITRFSVDDKIMTLDVRAINAFNGTVMYAGHHDVRYEGVLDVKASRQDIAEIATRIYMAFPVLAGPDIKVISLSGNNVTVNVGAGDEVKDGLGLLVYAAGDTLRDPITREELGDQICVGEGYVVEVKQKSSMAVLNLYERDSNGNVRERSTRVKIGDTVRFK